jgi:hypothetical protein
MLAMKTGWEEAGWWVVMFFSCQFIIGTVFELMINLYYNYLKRNVLGVTNVTWYCLHVHLKCWFPPLDALILTFFGLFWPPTKSFNTSLPWYRFSLYPLSLRSQATQEQHVPTRHACKKRPQRAHVTREPPLLLATRAIRGAEGPLTSGNDEEREQAAS